MAVICSLSRRRVLRGALFGAPVALGLPALEAMLNGHGEAYADGTPLPTRFGVWFFGTGVHDGWAPAQTGALKLPAGFTPLQRHLSKVSIVSGLKFESFGDYATNRHHMGASSVLAGAPPVKDKPGGITLDQLVAQQWKDRPLASLELGATHVDAISYNAAESPNAPLRDPRLVWQRLFGGPTRSAPRSPKFYNAFLDAVKGDVADLQRRLGRADQRRLDAYLDGVSELQKAVTQAPVCTADMREAGSLQDGSIGKPEVWNDVNKLNSRLLALALACNMTRVFSFVFSAPNSTPWFPIGVANNHHELGHQQHPDLPKSVGYIMESFAQLLDALAAREEGSGTVLDRTGIVVLTEVSVNHHNENLPIIVAGGSATRLKGGLHVRASGASTRASYTVARAVGAPLTSFGTASAKVTDEEVLGDVMA